MVIKYEEQLYQIQTSNILRHSIGALFGHSGKRKSKYKYDIGEIYYDKKILSRERVSEGNSEIKIYTCQCIIDNYVWNQREYSIDKHKCPVCVGKTIIPNINGIQIKYPEIYEIIIDENKECFTQKEKVHWKCPQCNCINYTQIFNLKQSMQNKQRLPCIFCGDGISFPEKVLNNVMRYISNSFITQAVFDWSNGKKYDVFDNDIFIEINGIQHYERTFENCGGRTLEEERINDKDKEILANKHYKNIKDYIIIDARISDFDFIKNNILCSNLKLYYDLSLINWDDVHQKSIKSLIVETAEYVNKNIKIGKISEIMGIDRHTIRRYIKQAVALNLCDYKFRKIKQVICLNDFSIYDNSKEAARKFQIKGHSNILDCCKNKIEYAGKHPISGEPLKWMYYDEYLENECDKAR